MAKGKGKKTRDDLKTKTMKPMIEARKTRSQTEPDRLKEKRAKEIEAARVADDLRKKRAAMLASRTPAAPGNRGDGNFHAAFVQMGQGDCTIMTTPAGRVIIIDCGSDATESSDDDTAYKNRVKSVLMGDKFLKGSTVVDALILTHADTDHYNKLSAVLPDGVQFQAVYHSDARDAYATGQTSDWIYTRTVNFKLIFAVEHHTNDGATAPTIRLGTKKVQAATATETVNRLDGQGGIRIIDEPQCKVSLLAANVNTNTPPDNSNPRNRGSIVTLIEVFGEKLLMCGDATRATEKYVLDQHAARITNVSLAQAGHHGSDKTSSSPEYVSKVNPKVAVVSAGKQVVKDHLPSYNVLYRYINMMTGLGGRATDIAEHEIFFWKSQGSSGGFTFESDSTVKPVYVTGSWSTFYLTLTAPGG
jgi:beta-lactamase superfamily II metal-dependent hydrolase